MPDRDAEFGEFLDTRAVVMRRTAYLLCGGDWHRAEDLVQTTLTKDVKRLLGRAFGPEPPLRLDRDELFRRGRRRVRARWMAASGGVAAAVVAVAVGIALLPSLGKPVHNPALGSSTTTPTSARPTTFVPPSLPPGQVPRTTDERATALTKVLLQAHVFPAELEIVPLGATDVAALQFAHDGRMYHVAKDVRNKQVLGTFELLVMFPSDVPVRGCDVIEDRQLSCQQGPAARRLDVGQDVRGAPRHHRVHTVSAIRDDGTRLRVASTALPFSRLSDKDWAPERPVPPVSVGVLTRIAALPGLSYF